MNFDDYLETWKECATSTISEIDVPGMTYSNQTNSHIQSGNGALPVNFDPYALTRASSMGLQRPQQTEIPSSLVQEIQPSSDARGSPKWKGVADDKRQVVEQHG